MRLRLIFFLIIFVVFPIAIYMRFGDLGVVRLNFLEYSFQMSGYGLLAAFCVFFVLLKGMNDLLRFPEFWSIWKLKNHYKKRVTSLVDVLTAQSLGDVTMLNTAVEEMGRYWNNTPIHWYYSEQVGLGDRDTLIAALIQDPDSFTLGRFLRAKKQLTQNNWASAYQTLQEMHENVPYAPWVLTHLFECACRLEKFEEAQDYIGMMHRFRLFPKNEIDAKEGHLLVLRAASLPATEALKLYMKAVSLNPREAGVAVQAARTALTLNKNDKVREIVESVWKNKPILREALSLVDVYVASFPIHSEVEKLDYLQKLQALIPTYEEALRVEAYFAIKARLWTRARKVLLLIESKKAIDSLLWAMIYAGEEESLKEMNHLEEAFKLMLQEM